MWLIQGDERGTYSRARTSYVETTEGEIRYKSHLGTRLGRKWHGSCTNVSSRRNRSRRPDGHDLTLTHDVPASQ